ncbi:hypothetical protein P9B03_01980 [Metasolibacillus meyeri]|uniref:Uncharacterized protein n=1 Tax=Metasolibacillus meyeri TaxID=1071052 RepID=A0AAW9NNC9_9BACL|nr:hypothetical protein [Metasolibacillus meyeri]MEC1177239.1 hypothetical protein [Metasolibacillus meyeri]
MDESFIDLIRTEKLWSAPEETAKKEIQKAIIETLTNKISVLDKKINELELENKKPKENCEIKPGNIYEQI